MLDIASPNMKRATHKDKVVAYLELEPLFRERKNKDRGIVNILMGKYQSLFRLIERGDLTKEEVVAIVQDYGSMDRSWRKALEEREDLRGKDYDEKDELERRKMAELGYNVGR